MEDLFQEHLSLLWKISSRNIVSKPAVRATWTRRVSFTSSLLTESTSKIVLYWENLKISPLKPKQWPSKCCVRGEKKTASNWLRGRLHQRLGPDWRTIPWNTFLSGTKILGSKLIPYKVNIHQHKLTTARIRTRNCDRFATTETGWAICKSCFFFFSWEQNQSLCCPRQLSCWELFSS